MQITCKSRTMPAYIPPRLFFFVLFCFLLSLRYGPLGNPSRNNGTLITPLVQCSGWSVCCTGDDKSEGGFWSVFGTYTREPAHWSPATAALNPNIRRNLCTYILQVSAYKALSLVTGSLLPPCFFRSQGTNTTNHLLDGLVRAERLSQCSQRPP